MGFCEGGGVNLREYELYTVFNKHLWFSMSSGWRTGGRSIGWTARSAGSERTLYPSSPSIPGRLNVLWTVDYLLRLWTGYPVTGLSGSELLHYKPDFIV